MSLSSVGRRALPALLACLAAGSSLAATPDMSVIGKIPGPDGGWDYASINAATHQLYVGRTDGVMAVDLDTGKLTDPFVPGSVVHGVIAIGDSELGVSANGKSRMAIIFDTKSGRVLASIPTGEGPDAVAYDPATSLVAIMEGDAQAVFLIDPKAMKNVGTIALDGKPEFAASDGHGHLLINIEDKHEIARVDIASRKVVYSVALPGCESPTGLAYDGDDDVAISTCRNGVADVTDAKTGAARATVAIGQGPDAAIYDSTHKVFYVPCGRSGTLSVIAVRSPADIALVATVPTALGARTGAFDAKTGKLYLPTAQYQLPIAPGTRPQTVPGTFEIVVVGPK
jgi:DNA-binding beta-propeller fold protein YncE